MLYDAPKFDIQHFEPHSSSFGGWQSVARFQSQAVTHAPPASCCHTYTRSQADASTILLEPPDGSRLLSLCLPLPRSLSLYLSLSVSLSLSPSASLRGCLSLSPSLSLCVSLWLSSLISPLPAVVSRRGGRGRAQAPRDAEEGHGARAGGVERRAWVRP